MAINITPSKETIFKKIRQALTQSTPLPFPQSENSQGVYPVSAQELELEFAERFTKLQGKFAYCHDKQDLADQLNGLLAQQKWEKVFYASSDPELQKLLGLTTYPTHHTNDLAGCDVSVTFCECLVARTGSMVLSAAQHSGRTVSVYAPIHICIAFTSQLVYDVKDALQLLKDKYGANIPSQISFATGPSRTADIEKTLVVGVHGPKEVYCFLVEG